jgi:N-acetylglucosaminyldiphosphoundecaprenol N-acetyl-beta-D-mannosaminyltransferase
MQRAGLEWFFRLCHEPRRLWKRYLKNNPLFVARILCQLMRLKRFPLE